MKPSVRIDAVAAVVTGAESGLGSATALKQLVRHTRAVQHVIDTWQQLFGGYGYQREYPIAQMYKDVRVERIYGEAARS